MKTLKSLLMLCAGLSFCACGSDNEPQFPEGEGRVEVIIVAPQTRGTTSTPSTGPTINVTGAYTVTLFAASGTQTETIAAGAETKKAVFNNVTSPTKVTVTLNSAKAEYDADDIENLQQAPASIPAYGETSTFGTGSTNVVDGKNVTTYTAAVTMAIPVARLEIGTIAFNNANNTFTTLTAGGVYLDKLRNDGSIYNGGSFNEQATGVTDYQFGGSTNLYGKGIAAILKDAATTNMLGQSAVLPSAGNVYAYNFFGATPNQTLTDDALTEALAKNPQFKIYFSSTQTSSETTTSPRYAMITKYKSAADDTDGIVLENGKIYKITNVTLADKNVILDEENNTVYSVEVTVAEAAWSVETTFADWAQ